MSEENELYPGVDRGMFRVMRLLDNSGVQLRAQCRLKNVSVFNFLSDLQYAVIGYGIEWWPDAQPGPHEGGEATPYIPRGRPNISRLYFRGKTSITPKMLHLEDAIINDFINSKALADPMTYSTYALESAEQNNSAATWRPLGNTPFEYANAVHITKFEATSSTPLEVTVEGLRFEYRRATMPEDIRTADIKPNKFTKLRDCYEVMEAFINNEVTNGNF
ncbi:hypothetical protein D9M68_17760 [compost metagenome]